MKRCKAMKLLILPMILSILLTACGKDENTAESSSQAGEGVLSVEEENSKTQAIDALLEELLFVDEHDREYLTPDTDDFRSLIYDIPEIHVLCEYGIRCDEMGFPMAYTINTSGKERTAGCRYIEVISYDRESGNNIVRQKLVFDNEEDALHPYVAENQEFWFFFEDYSGVYGVIPDDFDENSAIRTICDEFIPDTARSGENSETIREGNIWYKVYYEDGRFFPLDSFAGLYLYSNTSEYSARNVDENGISRFTGKYQYLRNGQVVIEERDVPVTVYYSMPENHGKNNDPELSLADVEKLLNNPDDSTYFKPATADYIYVIEQLDEAGSTIILASFDENGMLVQFVDREERTDDYGFGNTILGDYQFLSADKMVFYSDKYALFEAEGDASFTDRSRKEFLEEYELEKAYSWESNIQIIEAK